MYMNSPASSAHSGPHTVQLQSREGHGGSDSDGEPTESKFGSKLWDSDELMHKNLNYQGYLDFNVAKIL